jgi:hypothetical protein
MHINPLRAAIGWRWVRDGFAVLRRQPVALLAITFLNLMLLSLSLLIPVFGPVAPLVLTPVLTVGLMHAVRASEAGRMPSPLLLVAGFKDGGGNAWRPLLILGGFNATATLLALALAALVDGGQLMDLVTGGTLEDPQAIDENSLLYSAIVFVLVYTPAQMALWYAPLLSAWHDIPPFKALFFSFFAVLRNKGAFLVFGLGWFGVAFVASFGVRVLDALLGDNTVLLSMLLSPLSLLMLTAVYCSFWATYRDAVVEAEVKPRLPR